MDYLRSPSGPLLVLVLWELKGSWSTRQEPTVADKWMGSAIGKGFLMEGERPDRVTPIHTGNGEEPGTMEGVGKGGVEAVR